MTQKRIIYYIAFPIFMAFLCFFSYQLGFSRGEANYKKEQISKVLGEFDKTEGEGSKLTYYEELHNEKNPIVEQVNSDQSKKNMEVLAKAPTAVAKSASIAPAPTQALKPEVIAVVPKTVESNSAMAVQVGAFTDLGKADELTDRLKNSGFDAFTKPVQSKGNELFRVLVRSPKEEIVNIQSKLTTQGFKNTFVVSK